MSLKNKPLATMISAPAGVTKYRRGAQTLSRAVLRMSVKLSCVKICRNMSCFIHVVVVLTSIQVEKQSN